MMEWIGHQYLNFVLTMGIVLPFAIKGFRRMANGVDSTGKIREATQGGIISMITRILK